MTTKAPKPTPLATLLAKREGKPLDSPKSPAFQASRSLASAHLASLYRGPNGRARQ